MRTSIWLMALLAAAPVVPAQARKPAPTCGARYDINNSGVDVAGFGTVPRTIVLDGDAIDIDGWCRLEGLKPKAAGKKAVRIRRRFRSCGALPSGRLDVMLLDACSSLRTTVKLGKRDELIMLGIRHVPPGTFQQVVDRVFSDRGCAVSTCHGATHEGNLDLRPARRTGAWSASRRTTRRRVDAVSSG